MGVSGWFLLGPILDSGPIFLDPKSIDDHQEHMYNKYIETNN